MSRICIYPQQPISATWLFPNSSLFGKKIIITNNQYYNEIADGIRTIFGYPKDATHMYYPADMAGKITEITCYTGNPL